MIGLYKPTREENSGNPLKLTETQDPQINKLYIRGKRKKEQGTKGGGNEEQPSRP